MKITKLNIALALVSIVGIGSMFDTKPKEETVAVAEPVVEQVQPEPVPARVNKPFVLVSNAHGVHAIVSRDLVETTTYTYLVANPEELGGLDPDIITDMVTTKIWGCQAEATDDETQVKIVVGDECLSVSSYVPAVHIAIEEARVLLNDPA